MQDDSLAAPVVATPTPPRMGSRGRRRRLAIVFVGALVLLGATAAAALVATRESVAIVEVPSNSVGVIDPSSNDTVASIPVGIRPGPLAAGAGWVWVANLDDRNVTRIDAEQRSVAGTVSLGDRTATGLAFGTGALWVSHGLRGELSRVDPRLDRVTDSIAVTNRAPSGSLAFGAGHVWAVYGDSTLARVRPDTMSVTGSALTGALPTGVTVGDRAVWVANAGDSTVQRFDPLTFEAGAIREVSVGGQASAIAYGEGAVWVANRGDDTVTRIDPTTHGTLDVRVGDQPAAVAVGAGGVWVANAGDGSVSRIDPETHEVLEQITVGGSPAGVVVADGFVWVAVQAP
jgi:YVTN family beta-propeller protein